MTFFATMAWTGLGLLPLHRTEAAAAGEHYTILREYQGTMSPLVRTVVDRVLGLLAQTMGNLDQAMSHFEDSLAFCRKAGYRPELTWTCSDYPEALRGRDSNGDRAKALSLLDEFLAISADLDTRPLMEVGYSLPCAVTSLPDYNPLQPRHIRAYRANVTTR